MCHLNGLTKCRKWLFVEKSKLFMNNSLKRSLLLSTHWGQTWRKTLLSETIGSACRKTCVKIMQFSEIFVFDPKQFFEKNPKCFLGPKSSQNLPNMLRTHYLAILDDFWHSDELISEFCTISYFEQYTKLHLTQKSKNIIYFSSAF